MLKSTFRKEIMKQANLANLKRLINIFITHNSESIDIHLTANKILHSRLSAYIIKNSQFNIGGSQLIKTTPKGRKVLAGDGVYFLKYGGGKLDVVMATVKTVDKTVDAVGLMDNIITLTVKKGDLDSVDELINKIYPIATRLPVIYNASLQTASRNMHGQSMAMVGVIPKHFGRVEQFVSKEVYELVDVAFNRIVNDPQWYDDRDKTRKETLYLYGPPGTGKTTLIRHMASKYGLDLVIVKPAMFSSLSFLDTGKPVIYLMEDIDSDPELIRPEINAEAQKGNGFARIGSRDDDDYSSFINTLDGAKPLVNAISVMTTNYPEKILPSVVRKGRVDHRILLDHLTVTRVVEIIGWDENDERRVYLETNRKDGDVPIGLIPELKTAETVEQVITLLTSEDDESHLETYTK